MGSAPRRRRHSDWYQSLYFVLLHKDSWISLLIMIVINISVVTPCLSIWLDIYNWAKNIWNLWNQQYFQAGSFSQERHAGSVLCAEDPGARRVHRERGVDGQLPDGVQLGHEHRTHLDQGGVDRLRLGQAGLGQGGHHRVALVLAGPGQLLLITKTRRLTPCRGRFWVLSLSQPVRCQVANPLDSNNMIGWALAAQRRQH